MWHKRKEIERLKKENEKLTTRIEAYEQLNKNLRVIAKPDIGQNLTEKVQDICEENELLKDLLSKNKDHHTAQED